MIETPRCVRQDIVSSSHSRPAVHAKVAKEDAAGYIETVNVILHPAADKTASDHHGAHRRTVSAFFPYLDEAARQLLNRQFPAGELFARGANVARNGSNKTQWDKIAAGDVALFLRDSKVVGSGEVVHKLRSADLSRDLGWELNNDSDLPYELIYMVGNVTPLDLPRAALWQALGYRPGADQVGLRVLDANKTERALQWLSENAPISATEIRAVVEQLLGLESTDVERASLSRREQRFWRQYFFSQSQTGRCAACCLTLPIELLVAAHIKPRWNCTHEERLDPANVIPMCLLGCDALFERAYMTVDPDGNIGASERATGALRTRLNSVQGRRIAGWSPACRKYYESRASSA
jgi:hypothetical protein